jgi:AcrR family transcriptional regulator
LVETTDKKSNLERLVEAAICLFAQKGYQGTTLNEVAAEAGLTKPTIYNYFANKAELYEGVLRHVYGKMHSELESAVSLDASCFDRLKAVIHAMIDFSDRHADLIKVIHTIMFLPEDVRPRVDPLLMWEHRFGVIFRLAKEGVDRDEFRGDPMDVALIVSGTFGSLILSQVLHPSMPLLQAGIDERLWTLIHRGIGRPSSCSEAG